MTATRCPGRRASAVHFLYHILIFTSGVMGQKGIRRFEEYSLFRVASNSFCLQRSSVLCIENADESEGSCTRRYQSQRISYCIQNHVDVWILVHIAELVLCKIPGVSDKHR